MIFWWILDQLSKNTLYAMAILVSLVGIVSGMVLVSSRSHKFDTISKISLLFLIGSLLILFWVMEFLANHG